MAEQEVMEGEVQVGSQPLPGEIMEHRALISRARGVKPVESPAQYEAVGKLRVEIDLAYKAQKGANDVFCKGLSDMHKRGTKRRSDLLEPYIAAVRALDIKLASFRKLEEEKREAEELKIAEEMRKKAEEEALQAAQEAEDAGDDAMAEAIIEEPVLVPPVQLQTSVPKVQGLHKKREIWKARVVSLKALNLAIAQNKAPIYLIEANMVTLNQMARNGKNTISVPGVQFYQEK
ncbi:MAG: hypothetical protein ABGX83_05340 [Nitrospira sp.]